MQKLKLTTLSEAIVKAKESNAIRGGNKCNCSCYWEGKGGSTMSSNRNSNYELNTWSQHGCNQYLKQDSGFGEIILGTFDTHE